MTESEVLPKVDGDAKVSAFNFEFSSSGYELNKL